MKARVAAGPLQQLTVHIVGAPFRVIWTPEDGVIRAAGFEPEQGSERGDGHPAASGLWERLARQDPELASRGIAAAGASLGREAADADDLAAAASGADFARVIADALLAYAAGDPHALDALAVSQPETPFRGRVWQALRGIQPGEPVSYAELATRAGNPAAVRAAASGCATNLIALIVPCHRVVRADGKPGEYLFGSDIKSRLLEHESRMVSSSSGRADPLAA